MNYKIELAKYSDLLNEVGIELQDREYSSEEISRDINKIAEYAMSGSSKNHNISVELSRFNPVIDILNSNAK